MTRFLPIALLAACSVTEPPPAAHEPHHAELAPPTEAPAEIPDFAGVVTSRNTRVVSAEFQGRVDRIQIFAGQKVRAGEPIAKLDATQLKTQILTAKSQEEAAIGRARQAGASGYAASFAVRREKFMNRTGTSSPAKLQEAIAQAGQAGAGYSAEMSMAKGHRAEAERLQALIDKAQVTAPMDGVVMMVKVKEGELAQQGQPLARVFDPKDLLMKFAVPKEHRHLVALGKRVELRIDGVEHPVWATIERIADEEPPITFAVVEADIDDSKLRPDEVRVAAQGRVRIAEAVAVAPAGTKR